MCVCVKSCQNQNNTESQCKLNEDRPSEIKLTRGSGDQGPSGGLGPPRPRQAREARGAGRSCRCSVRLAPPREAPSLSLSLNFGPGDYFLPSALKGGDR